MGRAHVAVARIAEASLNGSTERALKVDLALHLLYAEV